MSDPTDPTTPGTEPTPGTDLEKKARGDVTVTTEETTDAPRKNNRLTAIIVGLLIVVGLGAIAAITFAVLAPQGTTPTDPNAVPSAEASGDATDPEAEPVEPEVPVAEDACTTVTSSASLGAATAGPGNVTVPIVFTNTSDSNCSLEGFPSVGFIRGTNGTQIGAGSTTSQAVEVTRVDLAPGATATSLLTISTTPPQDCTSVQADGIRITLPRSEESFIIDTTDYSACENIEAELLNVQAIVAG